MQGSVGSVGVGELILTTNANRQYVCIPVICEETGFYGGNYSILGKDRKDCFKTLERLIQQGIVTRREYNASTPVSR